MLPFVLLFTVTNTEASARKRSPLVDVNPLELDFLSTGSPANYFSLRFKYRSRTLTLQFNKELHFPGSKKYWLASFDDEFKESSGVNLSRCVYDVTDNHEFPQLLDEPDESSFVVFRCAPNTCDPIDVGCKDNWNRVKIALLVMIILILIVSIFCFWYKKAKIERMSTETGESVM